MSCYCLYEVLVPRLAGVLQRSVDVLFNPLLQVADLRVHDPIWELAHVPLQPPIHQFEATGQEFCVLIGRADTESWIDAPDWIRYEVGERLVEGSNGEVGIFLENEERAQGEQRGEYIVEVEAQECGNGGWREGICSQYYSTENRSGPEVVLWVVVIEGLLKN
jgi:hypothetical protein